MERFARFVYKTTHISANIAIVMLLLIFLLTCIDIIGTKIKVPVTDAVEVTGFLQSILIPAGAAAVLFRRQHIRIETFTVKLPKRAKQIIDGIVSIVLFVLFAVIAWQYFDFGIAKHLRGEYSSSLQFPFYYIIYLTAFSFVPLCLATLLEFYTNLFNKEYIKEHTNK